MTWVYSDDGGVTWSKPTPLTSRPFHAGYGNDTGQPNLGDYNGLTSLGGTIYASFATTPEISPFTGGQPSGQFSYPSFLPGLNPVGFRKAASAAASLRLGGQVSFTESGGNGFLDPGETAFLTIPLQNFVTNSLSTPATYTGVSATLTTTNSGVIVRSRNPSLYKRFARSFGEQFGPICGLSSIQLCGGNQNPVRFKRVNGSRNHDIAFFPREWHPLATTIYSENFGSVPAGSLPAGWSVSHAAGNTTVPGQHPLLFPRLRVATRCSMSMRTTALPTTTHVGSGL